MYTYTKPWPFPKRNVSIMMPQFFILFSKSVRIELVRIRVVLLVAVNTKNWNYNRRPFFNGNILIRYLIVVNAFSCKERYWRVLPQSFCKTWIFKRF